VQVFQDQDDTCCIELTVFGREQSYFLHHFTKILSVYVLSYIVDIKLSLEIFAKFNDERKTERLEDLLLFIDILLDLVFQYLILFE
jgi:hypothetical protein